MENIQKTIDDHAKDILRKKIRKSIEEKGISISKAAQSMGYDQRNFDKMLKLGRSGVSVERLLNICHMLGMQVNLGDLRLEAWQLVRTSRNLDEEVEEFLKQHGRNLSEIDRFKLLRGFLLEKFTGDDSVMTSVERDELNRYVMLKVKGFKFAKSENEGPLSVIRIASGDGYRFLRSDEPVPIRTMSISDMAFIEFSKQYGSDYFYKQVIETITFKGEAVEDIVTVDGKVLWAKNESFKGPY